MALNRPEYRDPRFPRSVKVYTIAQESKHIIIKNIPALSGEEAIIQDLLKQCRLYGEVKEWRLLDKEKENPFMNSLYVQYGTIEQGRLAKNKISGFVFYASILQATYAPEYDSIDDLRSKFQNRQLSVYKRLQRLAKDSNKNNRNKKNNNKRRQQQQQYDTMIKKDTDDHSPLITTDLPSPSSSSLSSLKRSNTITTTTILSPSKRDNNKIVSMQQIPSSSSSMNKKQRRRI